MDINRIPLPLISANGKFLKKIREGEEGKEVRVFNTQTPSLCGRIRVPISLTIAAPLKTALSTQISPWVLVTTLCLTSPRHPEGLGELLLPAHGHHSTLVVSFYACQEPFYSTPSPCPNISVPLRTLLTIKY